MVGLDITTINAQSNITTAPAAAQLRPLQCPESAFLSEFNRCARGSALWCTAIGARSPGHDASRQLYVFNQPEAHKEPSGSLSLSLSLPPSLCRSVALPFSVS